MQVFCNWAETINNVHAAQESLTDEARGLMFEQNMSFRRSTDNTEIVTPLNERPIASGLWTAHLTHDQKRAYNLIMHHVELEIEGRQPEQLLTIC